MKVVVIGSGGREHAIVRALRRSPLVATVYAWPGNDGIFLDAKRVSSMVKDRRTFGRWAKEEHVDLVVIGPETELVAGWTDDLRALGILVFGPSKEAAQLEESKVFSKQFMLEFRIPTARAAIVNSKLDIAKSMTRFSPPYVLKVDGLAAGKGVYICKSDQELINAGSEIFDQNKFGLSGSRALLEEFLPGEELSVLVLTNGSEYQILPFCRDHKRLLDNDLGPNTGGMGVVAPVNIPQSINEQLKKIVVEPTIKALKARNYLYRGVIFIGVMLTKQGPQVLEYNVRWGDPEAQAIMPLLDGDWAEVFRQMAEGSMPQLKWKKAATACLVLAAEGYPETPVKGVEIAGPKMSDLKPTGDQPIDFTEVEVLHAGTRRLENGRFVTNGGRVINIVARAATLGLAIEQAYQGLSQVHWPGMQYRRDIGKSVNNV